MQLYDQNAVNFGFVFFSLVASKPPAESLERLLMLRQQNNIHMQIYRHTL